jgi:spore coat polysaccharide biosynthesis protein SpsF
MKKNIVFLQARLDSKRLPGKVLLPINGIAMINLQISRILESKKISELVVLIPDTNKNDPLFEFLRANSIKIFRGALDNVFDRFMSASRLFPSDSIIRLTADCPLVMPNLIDEMIEKFEKLNVDYLSNAIELTFPDGLDIEIFKSSALATLSGLDLSVQEKEHVTLGMYSRPEIFSIVNHANSRNLGSLRWTVDYQEDFDFVSKVFKYFRGREHLFGIEEVLEFVRASPENQNKLDASYRNISIKKK